MADIRGKIDEIYSLEQLSAGETGIHRLHPLVKIVSTLLYILCLVSCGRYDLARLIPYILYPSVVTALAEIPNSVILRRTLPALPFCLLAGISNLLWDRNGMAVVGGVTVSCGMVAFLALLLRTFLCVAAVMILVAVTPFAELTGALRRLRIPDLFVSLLEMTYRYIGTLLSEASSMYTAYKLRSRNKKGLEMRDMGSFVGQLLLRSFDRAERVYHAMKCRGYPADWQIAADRKPGVEDISFLLAVCGLSLFFRFADILGLFSRWLGGLL